MLEDGCLPEEECLGSAEPIGELLWGAEVDILANSVSRLLETAARLEEPPERPKKVELDNYTVLSFEGQELNMAIT